MTLVSRPICIFCPALCFLPLKTPGVIMSPFKIVGPGSLVKVVVCPAAIWGGGKHSDGRRNLVDPYKLKGDLNQKSNVFYIDRGVPWDVLGGSGSLSRPSVKIRCRAYYHFKDRQQHWGGSNSIYHDT